jgi:RNA polymerase sigma-70 factor (ECF subfamily)
MNAVVSLRPTQGVGIGDGEAIENVLSGNREMFEVIVRRYNPLLYRVGMAYLRSHAQAEDAMQNTYLKAFLNLGRFRRGAAFSTWLTRIMINECLMVIRRRKKASENTISLEGAAGPIAAPQARDEISLKEMKALLEQAIAKLPRKYRAVYVMREVQQMTTAATAASLGLSPESVKVDLHRARERLKEGIMKDAAGVELFAYPALYCDGMTDRVLRAVQAIA